ncbi:MAG: hypothetical protein AABW88_02460 [Nanoarchaeota archaeon]
MKKGAVSYLNVIILAVVVLIVMLSLTKIVTDSISSSAKIGKCGASLLKSSFLDKTVTFGIRQGAMSCNNLPDLTIKKSDVSVGSKIKDAAVKKVIADKMLDCWKMVGKGLIDPYKNYANDQSYCLTCSDIIFDKDFIESAKEQQYELTDNIYWLATNPVPGLETTYFEDLFGVKPESDLIRELKEKEAPIDVLQQYSIVWRMEKRDTSLATTLIAGALGGSVTGAYVGQLGGVIGGAFGTLLFPGAGTTIGAIIGVTLGAGGGAAAGTYGAIKVLNFAEGIGQVSSQILVVPKSQLGRQYVFGGDSNAKPKDFCTKLVNY